MYKVSNKSLTVEKFGIGSESSPDIAFHTSRN